MKSVERIGICLATVIFAYVGYVVGMVEYCNQIPELRNVKKYAWAIPFFYIVYPISVVRKVPKGYKLKVLLRYCKRRNKSVLILVALARHSARANSNNIKKEP